LIRRFAICQLSGATLIRDGTANREYVVSSEHAKAKALDRKRQQDGLRPWPAGFTKISAVEGIRLKPAMKKRAAEAGSKGLSPEEYRKAIVRARRKA
jgi:hypothetical protein